MGYVLSLLEPNFYVACVSYDGFNETEQTTFPDMLTETEKLECYIRDHFGGHIRAAYSYLLGGSFVGLLAAHKKIHIDFGGSDLTNPPNLLPPENKTHAGASADLCRII
ncbi:hypothetical protein OBV_14950 [Oscillibacter valericigenes Sjm18-20]|nr:hypothetical protein OBV_14950 [Oscillibacter valericigenes Sjm18-20]